MSGILISRRSVRHRSAGGANGFTGLYTVTIDHTKCGTADTTSYPFLFKSTIANLKTTANGGYVTSASGYDIVPCSDAGLTTPLDFELTSYNATTGAVNMWVRIPTLSHSADTVIYLGVGKASITTSQENITGTWESSFHGVWHLDGAGYSATQRKDSTSNANSLSNGAGASNSGTGIVGECLTLGFQGLGAVDNASVRLTSAFTVEAWCIPGSFTNFRSIVGKGSGTVRNYHLYANQTDGKPVIVFTQGASNFKYVTGGAALSTSAWNYCVGTFDGTTLRLFTNAAADGTLGVSGATDNPTQACEIGGINGGQLQFIGSLDEVRISNTARSTSYLTSTYNNLNSPSTFYTVT